MKRLGTCVVVSILLAACAGPGPGRRNQVIRDYKEKLQDTWNAAESELTKQGYSFKKRDMPKDGGMISFTGGSVRIKKHDYMEGWTRVYCNVGTIKSAGDRDKVEKLLNGMSDDLKTRGD